MPSGGDYGQLADLVVQLAEGASLVSHAFVALDHDEYGAERIGFDVHDSTQRRAYHYLAYPRDEDTDEYYTEGEPSSVIRVPLVSDDPGVPETGGPSPGSCRTLRST
ncbi:hypothetical protein OOK41_14155 [Micromonospora sp. NBC_01655]|uniref:hypothetical protein n=1 Tax=Micromonospora sp. NBC_01655 TaxID=2975983 RepID=UPI002259F1B9|nr:hypothetical protein [Micromonospora sp. NBC_01655]MCX4471434.1 hypothetical protein [Micromonospora sp. NBC_01655]